MVSTTQILIGLLVIGAVLSFLWPQENTDVEVVLPIDSPNEAISYAKTDGDAELFLYRDPSKTDSITKQAKFDSEKNIWIVQFRSGETQFNMGIYPNGTVSYKGYGV